MKIALIGFMGSGKSSTALLLAPLLGMKVIELDELVLNNSGLPSISEIFAQKGQQFFRDLETEALRSVVEQDSAIISCGGGLPTRPENIALLQAARYRIIYLRADFDTLKVRLEGDTTRPLFSDPAKAKVLHREREKIYAAAADFVIDSASLSATQAARAIGLLLTPRSQNQTDAAQSCLVIGDPVGHSLSPRMHNRAYKEVGLEHDFFFSARRVPGAHLADFVAELRTSNIRGVSCTIPHKEQIMRMLDIVDPIAAKIGAVNTVVNEAGKLTGFNTDWRGALDPLEKLMSLKGKKVALLGAGGAARAVLYALTRAGADVTVYNRTKDRALALTHSLGGKVGEWGMRSEIRSAHVIINSTSLGLGLPPTELPLPAECLQAGQILFDTVYATGGTTLLKEGKARGLVTIDGLEMLLYQGMQQFKLYTNHDAPEQSMRASLGI